MTTYFVTTSARGYQRHLHTDRDCPALSDVVTDIREARDGEADRFDTCSFCGDDFEPARSFGPQLKTKLLDMDPDEVGRDSAGGRS